MKKRLFIITAGIIILIGIIYFLLPQWEYKTCSFYGEKNDSKMSDFLENKISVSEYSLNELGKEGWELVSSYEFIETVHPNFGNSNYVSGLQPNVRTSKISFVFKRKKCILNKIRI